MLAKQRIKVGSRREEKMAKLRCFAEGWGEEEERRERKMRFRLALVDFRCPDVNGHEVTNTR
jgi:hypothetical protein